MTNSQAPGRRVLPEKINGYGGRWPLEARRT
jgi:hypothetical protein